MLEGDIKCSMCRKEPANQICYCNKQLTLIGTNCVVNHLTKYKYSHYLSVLSSTFGILSTSQPYTLPTIEKQDSNLNSFVSISTISQASLQSDALLSLSCIHILQLPISHLRSPSASKPSSFQTLYYINTSMELCEYSLSTKILQKCLLDVPYRPEFPNSTCIIPSKSLAISSYTGQTSMIYLFKPLSNSYIQLFSLTETQYEVKLHYSSKHLYAFKLSNQGINSCERYDFDKNRWIMLPGIKNSNISIAPLSADNLIYIFNGKEKIDVLNTNSLHFRQITFKNSFPYEHSGVAALIDDKIYLITHDVVQVYNPRLTQKFRQHWCPDTFYSSNDVITHQGVIYYYDNIRQEISVLNTSISTQFKHKTLSHYAKYVKSRYMYSTRNSYEGLIEYDIKHKTESLRTVNFDKFESMKGSGVCILPSGELFIAAIKQCRCYIYNPETDNTERVDNMINKRFDVGLLYHCSYVYAIGGYLDQKMSHVERFSLEMRKWEKLCDLVEPRRWPACVGIDKKVYTVCGGCYSMEVYNIEEDSSWLGYVMFEYEYATVAVIDDMIYVISKDYYKILDEELDIVQLGKMRYCYTHNITSSGTIAVSDYTIYFHNYETNWVEFANIRKLYGGIEFYHKR